jgi:DNA-directed RNA polymerase sigma subunit (sigma70/sigma32)
MSRVCGIIEVDPFYADVILKRWMSYTKQQATLTGMGTFSNVERERYKPVEV